MNSILKPFLAGALAALAVTVPWIVLEQRAHTRLKTEQTVARAELDTLRDARETLERLETAQSRERERLRREQDELLRLRGEVTRLRESAAALPARTAPAGTGTRQTGQTGLTEGFAGSGALVIGPPQAPAIAPGVLLPPEAARDVGDSTPEAALESLIWAMREGNFERIIAAYLPAEVLLADAPAGANLDDSIVPAPAALDDLPLLLTGLMGVEVMSRFEVGPDEVILQILNRYTDGAQVELPMMFHRVGNDWKIAPELSRPEPPTAPEIPSP